MAEPKEGIRRMAIAAPPARRKSLATTLRTATPHEIISSARRAPARFHTALAMAGSTAMLMWGAFTPLDFGALGWVCVIPLMTLARVARPPHKMYVAAFLGGMLFWLLALQWMPLAHNAMYAAWVLLAIYEGLYFPLCLALTRVAVWRYSVPLTLAAPIVWTGLELLRGHLMTGFCWYYLGHTQHRWIELIQMADTVGTYGVSFLVALVAACGAELIPAAWLVRLGLLPAGAGEGGVRTPSLAGSIVRLVACLVIFAACLGYGHWRRAGQPFAAGPRVALVQTNVTSDVKHDPHDWGRIQKQLEKLTSLAVKEQPDLIVWPETMFRWPLVETPKDVSDEALQEAHPGLPIAALRGMRVRHKLATLGEMAGAGLVVGLEALDLDLAEKRSYNSAVLVKPDGTLAGRYDKLHRVPFGEFVPFAHTFPWLKQVMPYAPDLDAGAAAAVFRYQGFRFSPIICFEDTVPHLVRNIINVTSDPAATGPRRIDFLVNLTNDGWFHGSSELDQHLITAAFRCVEFRTPMVRAVNTGISAIIDGDGVVRRKAEGLQSRRAKQEEAVLVDTVPLDGRTSLYLKQGDLFAGSCLAVCSFLFLTGLAGQVGRRPAATTDLGGPLAG
ncbi:MAG: apolipoprotein N-acyltransferase [Planctomycetaceae bacterium]